MIRRSIIFSFVFTITDGIVYFVIALLSVIFLKGFTFNASMGYGAGMVITRLIYFQIFVEMFFLFLLRFFSFQKQVFVALVVNLLAFILPLVVLFGRLTIVPKFFPIYLHSGDLGPAWMLFASTLLTWLIMFKITPLSEWLD